MRKKDPVDYIKLAEKLEQEKKRRSIKEKSKEKQINI